MALGNTGITTSLVANTLGVGTRDVGQLCTSTNINMWSRCKPVHIPTDAPDRSMPADGNGAWWKGYFDNCGINFPATIGFEMIPDAYTSDKLNGYSYERPSGGQTSPYRLADFMYYKHDALPPFNNFNCDTKATQQGNITCGVSLNFAMTDKTGAGSISLDDLTLESNLSDWWFGAMLVDSSNRIERKLANVKPGYSLEIPASGLTLEQYYTVYPFITNNEISTINSTVGGTSLFLPIMNTAPVRVQIVSEEAMGGLVIKLNATYIINDMTGMIESIDYTISLKATLGNMTLTNNSLDMRFITSDVNDSMLIGEQSRALENISLTYNVERVISGQFIPTNKLQEYYLYLKLNNGQYTKKTYPFKPSPFADY